MNIEAHRLLSFSVSRMSFSLFSQNYLILLASMLVFGTTHMYVFDIGVTHVRGVLLAGVSLPSTNMQGYLVIHLNIKITNFQPSLPVALLLFAPVCFL
jgi:hypothetical protein